MINTASIAQMRKFFAVCRDLGLEAERAKERAKKKYGLDSFANITPDQLSPLIDLLEREVKKRNIQPTEPTPRDLDEMIIASGEYDITVCVECGEECVVPEASLEYPVCSRLLCVRQVFRNR